MVKGHCRQESGDFEYTFYTGGYSSASKTYYYSTYEDPALRTVTFDDCRGVDGLAKVAAV